MVATGLTPDATHGALTDAVDLLAQLPADAFQPGDATRLLGGVSRLVDRLGGEVARLANLVAVTGEWAEAGASSAAAFVSNTTAMGYGHARGTVELGDAMAATPALDSAVRSGSVSPAAAKTVLPAMGDDGFADVADDLIGELAGMKPFEARRHVDTWRSVVNPVDDDTRRKTARDGRNLKFRPAGDGMTHLNGLVPDDVAQGLRRALKRIADEQRLDHTERTSDQRRVDALGDLADAFARGDVGGGRNLARIIVTLTYDELFNNRLGLVRNADGDLMAPPTIRQLCCDAVIHRYVADQDGATLEFGTGKRTASPQQFLALVARDGGCRHPGCDRPPQWCEAHHLREFVAERGETNLDELVLLCHHHHHNLHDRSWLLSGTAAHLTFTGPTGQTLHSNLPRHTTTNAA